MDITIIFRRPPMLDMSERTCVAQSGRLALIADGAIVAAASCTCCLAANDLGQRNRANEGTARQATAPKDNPA